VVEGRGLEEGVACSPRRPSDSACAKARGGGLLGGVHCSPWPWPPSEVGRVRLPCCERLVPLLLKLRGRPSEGARARAGGGGVATRMR